MVGGVRAGDARLLANSDGGRKVPVRWMAAAAGNG
jgi:hypothetical protein